MSSIKIFLLTSITLSALLVPFAPTLAFAETCDQVCAAADEPGYNKTVDSAPQATCCCQADSASQTLVNRPESECAGVNPQASVTPSAD